LDYVADAIYRNKVYSINEINLLVEIKSMILLRQEYFIILDLAKAGQIEQIKDLPNNETDDGKLSEYLAIYTFYDQNEHKYIITVYDGDELWQDPQIWDIFQLEK
jgi:hypothetical protein